MVAMDRLQTHVLSALTGLAWKKIYRRMFQHTFTINKCQPISSYMVITQCIHSSDVRQWRHLVVLSWWEGLGANLVLVVDIQKA